MGEKVQETIRLFIASDQRMAKAEQALEYSIEKNVSKPWQIHWMRASDILWRVGEDSENGKWDIGRKPGYPYMKGWSTDFTCFRFAVPEAAGFQGYAIYMDVDMLVLKDLRDLLNREFIVGLTGTDKPWMCPVSKPRRAGGSAHLPIRTDFSLIDCERMKDVFPPIQDMKRLGWGLGQYVRILHANDLIGPLSDDYDCVDGHGFSESTRVLHFSDMHTQPWEPYPERFTYPPHPVPEVAKIWHEYYEESQACKSKK